MNKAEKLKIEEYIERAHAATTLYESYAFRFVKRANIELYKKLGACLQAVSGYLC